QQLGTVQRGNGDGPRTIRQLAKPFRTTNVPDSQLGTHDAHRATRNDREDRSKDARPDPHRTTTSLRTLHQRPVQGAPAYQRVNMDHGLDLYSVSMTTLRRPWEWEMYQAEPIGSVGSSMAVAYLRMFRKLDRGWALHQPTTLPSAMASKPWALPALIRSTRAAR